mmetsp:Transcript_6252/g.10529  ORF Transcript_6252/g.10529 Transcript_6252/m.10529 type:complete len:196 (+) Transcript_6252:3-590(+)
MIEYTRILFMDADTLAVGPLGSLLDVQQWLQHPSQHVAAVMDYHRGSWTAAWNSGVMLFKPNIHEATRINAILNKRDVRIPATDGDQSFLNWLYPHTSKAFVTLPLEFNGMSHVEVLQPAVWAEVMPKLHAIHFTTRKAWACPESYERSVWTVDLARACKGTVRVGATERVSQMGIACYCSLGYKWWRAFRGQHR